ncbi:MAG TPA: ATP-dependent RecD-like DNA helicase [Candidatus Binatia bacterium]|nr:ATP-dependent RecD-like DNA helicase [Candidatus Binatia bacterium]
MAEQQNERASLQGTVGRITYHNPENHYTVARLDFDGGPPTTIVGTIFPVSEGEEIKVIGAWKRHPRYGLQFHVDQWHKVDPATLEGIEKYLGSGLIKGIGPSYAKRLVQAFGLDTLQVLSDQPLRILEVDGIGEVRARRIMQAWQEQRGMQDVMVFLQGHGVGASLALRIYRVFGAGTIAQVRENPYALARQVHGVGFIIADRMAHSLGIRGDFPLRVQAGVMHILREAAERGHCFLPSLTLANSANEMLGTQTEKVEIAVEALQLAGDVILEAKEGAPDKRVYLTELFTAEKRVAAAITRLVSTSSFLQGERAPRPWEKGKVLARGAIDVAGASLFSELPVRLDEDQIQAAREALREKLFVITGGPGTGKTTLLVSLLAILRRAKITFALAAPTGRAAKRMQETCGEEAVTIHRLLEFNPREGGFQRDKDNPLQVDVVIVDEASMIDLTLMDHLLQAVEPHSHLILVGDVDQLPSVGPGSVLKDLIDSKAVPVAVLTRIFRQQRESSIVVNAHRILRGQALDFSDARERRDFDFVARESEEEVLAAITELLRDRIPQRLRLSADEIPDAVQVLTPMHRGLLGTVQLNRELQQLLNPTGEGLERGGSVLRVRDKVMQLRNNYEKGVFNGDLGRIISIDKEEGKIRVEFDDKALEYEAHEWDEISLAYATSVHKSQGSEYPVVILPLHSSHYMMLYRSILYTAVTRGKRLVIVVGSRKALAMAIRNVRVERRNTGLKERLSEYKSRKDEPPRT